MSSSKNQSTDTFINNSSSKPWFKNFKFLGIILAIVLILTASIFGLMSIRSQSDTYTFKDNIIRSYNPTFGALDARVEVVEFFDFQCSACRAQHFVFNEVKSEYADRVKFVFKNSPLSIFPLSKSIAQSANAVAKQDKEAYFDYIDSIYENQDSLNSSKIDDLAQSLDIDFKQYQKDKSSRKIKNQVSFDRRDLKEINLPQSKLRPNNKPKKPGETTATPTIIVYKDGQLYDWWSGTLPADDFKRFLDEVLAE
jgi:thiol-disulfide isomerase/thioredoxin